MDDLRRESFRLSSFQRFPASVPIDARKFAAAGFYYTGQFDEVKCFACSNTQRNLSLRTDPFLLSMHRSTCRFARGEDDCGNVQVDRQTSLPSNFAQNASAQQRPAGEVLTATSTPHRSPAQNAPTLLSNASVPRVTLAANVNPGVFRHYQGLDMRNFQTARPVAPPVPIYDVPIYRQLATIPNPDQARLIRSLNLCRESHRFQTFTGEWPREAAPSPEDMAASGWFYLGNLDRTQCFCCGGVLRNWRRLDNPNSEHIRHFSHCLMAQGHERRNIEDTGRQALSPPRRDASQLTEQQRSDLRIMFPCNLPVTPSMRSMEDRVGTFINWHFTRATPQIFAEAGFFSLGVRDRVKCFYCNGGLQNWRQTDNPWDEHAKWYPTCEFLLQQMGPEFIHNIVARFPNLNRPPMHSARQRAAGPPSVQSGPEVLPPPVSGPTTVAAPPPTASPSSQPTPAQSLDPLEAAMRSEAALTVVGMAFEEEIVRDVMRRNIERHGAGYQSAAALLDAVVEFQESREESDEEREHSVGTNAPQVFAFEDERMEDGHLDLGQSNEGPDPSNEGPDPRNEGPDLSNRGTDVPESGFLTSSLFSSIERGAPESLVPAREMCNGENSTNNFTHPCNIPDLSAAPSLTLPAPTLPLTLISAPAPHPPTNNGDLRGQLTSHSPKLQNKQELKDKLKAELQQLQEERACKVCLDREGDMVFIPCGHICCCLECAKALRTCPICRMKIEKAVRTYTS